jgi:hypothetical protein
MEQYEELHDQVNEWLEKVIINMEKYEELRGGAGQPVRVLRPEWVFKPTFQLNYSVCT